ncbi:MAG: exonuclease SbcCD subunit D [Eubacterium sp.]|nr:exonuclease SbcCD subunit D [Eubacterium sp.]
MKFLHLSDLHIGLKLINRDLREDQEYILDQAVELAKEILPDAIVIAGDIYDKAIPSAEAVEVFDRFIASLKKNLPDTAVMMISGNHDSARRIDCYRSVLELENFYMIGMPPQKEDEHIRRVTLNDEYGPVHFWLLPFIKPTMVRQIVGTDEKGNNLSYHESVKRMLEREEIHTDERNVLVSHQFYLPAGKSADEIERADSEIRTVGNIDEISAEVLKPFDYAALGHIHKPMKVGSEIWRYPGTPLASSVSEAGQQKGMILVEMGPKGDAAGLGDAAGSGEAVEPGKAAGIGETVKTKVIPFKPLRQLKVISGSFLEVLGQACDDYVSVELTDNKDLDMIDARDRIRLAFPNLLEVRRKTIHRADYSSAAAKAAVTKDPFELCSAFLPDMSEEQEKIMKDVINSILGS